MIATCDKCVRMCVHVCVCVCVCAHVCVCVCVSGCKVQECRHMDSPAHLKAQSSQYGHLG